MSYIDDRDSRTQPFVATEFGNAWAVHRGKVFDANDLTPFHREWQEWLEERDAALLASETLIGRLEAWARDREYDFTRVTRPEYVEGFRDAQSVVLGLIQAWEDPAE